MSRAAEPEVDLLWGAYLAAHGGAPERAELVQLELRAEASVEARAWATALDAAIWQAAPEGAFPADPSRAYELVEADRRAAGPVSVLCVEGGRTAWLLGRPDVASAWAELARAIHVDGAITSGAGALAEAYGLVTAGAWRESLELANRAEHHARAARLAPFVVEAASVAALCQLLLEELEEGIATARRAVRMARTEGLAGPAYLAGLVLARARRSAGHYHLAARILGSLARVVPPQWNPRLCWEHALAGIPTEAAPEPAASLEGVLQAYQSGALGTIDATWDALHRAAAGVEPFASDAKALAAVLGRAGAAAPSVEGFVHDVTPARATGFEGLPRPLGAQVLALVDVHPRRAAVRRLALGAPFCGKYLGSKRPGRPEAIVAALALAGGGRATLSELFSLVYGFEYVKERHENVLDVAFHRARALLGDKGSVEREGPHVVLEVRAPFSVPDTALEGSLSDRVLHALAVRARGSAREIAEDLQMPLRTVQSLLRELVEQGSCEQDRESRRVDYIVEDTTFREPTMPGWKRLQGG